MNRLPDRTPFITALRWFGKCFPGDFLKTFVYLNLVAAPRRVFRKFVFSFYRVDQIYTVLKEVKRTYSGSFAILEMGTANGYSFAKMLYATRYLGMEEEVTVHAFDSFEGLRLSEDLEDKGLTGPDWQQGQYKGDFETMKEYCDGKGYKNYRIHRGYFEDSMTPEVIEQFKVQKPILVWVDCDYYGSTKTVFERLLPILPSGCVFYFDDYDFNFGSRFTGEARLVHEVNQGSFGDDLEFLLDTELSLDSKRVYRFIRYGDDIVQYSRLPSQNWEGKPRPIADGSPFP